MKHVQTAFSKSIDTYKAKRNPSTFREHSKSTKFCLALICHLLFVLILTIGTILPTYGQQILALNSVSKTLYAGDTASIIITNTTVGKENTYSLELFDSFGNLRNVLLSKEDTTIGRKVFYVPGSLEGSGFSLLLKTTHPLQTHFIDSVFVKGVVSLSPQLATPIIFNGQALSQPSFGFDLNTRFLKDSISDNALLVIDINIPDSTGNYHNTGSLIGNAGIELGTLPRHPRMLSAWGANYRLSIADPEALKIKSGLLESRLSWNASGQNEYLESLITHPVFVVIGQSSPISPLCYRSSTKIISSPEAPAGYTFEHIWSRNGVQLANTERILIVTEPGTYSHQLNVFDSNNNPIASDKYYQQPVEIPLNAVYVPTSIIPAVSVGSLIHKIDHWAGCYPVKASFSYDGQFSDGINQDIQSVSLLKGGLFLADITSSSPDLDFNHDSATYSISVTTTAGCVDTSDNLTIKSKLSGTLVSINPVFGLRYDSIATRYVTHLQQQDSLILEANTTMDSTIWSYSGTDGQVIVTSANRFLKVPVKAFYVSASGISSAGCIGDFRELSWAGEEPSFNGPTVFSPGDLYSYGEDSIQLCHYCREVVASINTQNTDSIRIKTYTEAGELNARDYKVENRNAVSSFTIEDPYTVIEAYAYAAGRFDESHAIFKTYVNRAPAFGVASIAVNGAILDTLTGNYFVFDTSSFYLKANRDASSEGLPLLWKSLSTGTEYTTYDDTLRGYPLQDSYEFVSVEVVGGQCNSQPISLGVRGGGTGPYEPLDAAENELTVERGCTKYGSGAIGGSGTMSVEGNYSRIDFAGYNFLSDQNQICNVQGSSVKPLTGIFGMRTTPNAFNTLPEILAVVLPGASDNIAYNYTVINKRLTVEKAQKHSYMFFSNLTSNKAGQHPSTGVSNNLDWLRDNTKAKAMACNACSLNCVPPTNAACTPVPDPSGYMAWIGAEVTSSDPRIIINNSNILSSNLNFKLNIELGGKKDIGIARNKCFYNLFNLKLPNNTEGLPSSGEVGQAYPGEPYKYVRFINPNRPTEYITMILTKLSNFSDGYFGLRLVSGTIDEYSIFYSWSQTRSNQNLQITESVFEDITTTEDNAVINGTSIVGFREKLTREFEVRFFSAPAGNEEEYWKKFNLVMDDVISDYKTENQYSDNKIENTAPVGICKFTNAVSSISRDYNLRQWHLEAPFNQGSSDINKSLAFLNGTPTNLNYSLFTSDQKLAFDDWKKAMLAKLDQSIENTLKMHGQGLILWDVEGIEKSTLSAQYVGDPQNIYAHTPEMGVFNFPGANTDPRRPGGAPRSTFLDLLEYRITSSGLIPGLTIRPGDYNASNGNHEYDYDLSSSVAKLAVHGANEKILNQLKSQIDFSVDNNFRLFYIDQPFIPNKTTGGSRPIDAMVYGDLMTQLKTSYPTESILLAPERNGCDGIEYWLHTSPMTKSSVGYTASAPYSPLIAPDYHLFKNVAHAPKSVLWYEIDGNTNRDLFIQNITAIRSQNHNCLQIPAFRAWAGAGLEQGLLSEYFYNSLPETSFPCMEAESYTQINANSIRHPLVDSATGSYCNKYYADNGGVLFNYQDGLNSKLTLSMPVPSQLLFTPTGSIDLIANDTWTLSMNGASPVPARLTAPLLITKATGEADPVFHFTSDANNNGTGWRYKLSCPVANTPRIVYFPLSAELGKTIDVIVSGGFTSSTDLLSGTQIPRKRTFIQFGVYGDYGGYVITPYRCTLGVCTVSVKVPEFLTGPVYLKVINVDGPDANPNSINFSYSSTLFTPVIPSSIDIVREPTDGSTELCNAVRCRVPKPRPNANYKWFRKVEREAWRVPFVCAASTCTTATISKPGDEIVVECDDCFLTDGRSHQYLFVDGLGQFEIKKRVNQSLIWLYQYPGVTGSTSVDVPISELSIGGNERLESKILDLGAGVLPLPRYIPYADIEMPGTYWVYDENSPNIPTEHPPSTLKTLTSEDIVPCGLTFKGNGSGASLQRPFKLKSRETTTFPVGSKNYSVEFIFKVDDIPSTPTGTVEKRRTIIFSKGTQIAVYIDNLTLRLGVVYAGMPTPNNEPQRTIRTKYPIQKGVSYSFSFSYKHDEDNNIWPTAIVPGVGRMYITPIGTVNKPQAPNPTTGDDIVPTIIGNNLIWLPTENAYSAYGVNNVYTLALGNDAIHIGGGFAPTSTDFSSFFGQIRELKIWKKTLSELEVYRGIAKPLSGEEVDLFAYYRLAERREAYNANNSSVAMEPTPYNPNLSLIRTGSAGNATPTTLIQLDQTNCGLAHLSQKAANGTSSTLNPVFFSYIALPQTQCPLPFRPTTGPISAAFSVVTPLPVPSWYATDQANLADAKVDMLEVPFKYALVPSTRCINTQPSFHKHIINPDNEIKIKDISVTPSKNYPAKEAVFNTWSDFIQLGNSSRISNFAISFPPLRQPITYVINNDILPAAFLRATWKQRSGAAGTPLIALDNPTNWLSAATFSSNGADQVVGSAKETNVIALVTGPGGCEFQKTINVKQKLRFSVTFSQNGKTITQVPNDEGEVTFNVCRAGAAIISFKLVNEAGVVTLPPDRYGEGGAFISEWQRHANNEPVGITGYGPYKIGIVQAGEGNRGDISFPIPVRDVSAILKSVQAYFQDNGTGNWSIGSMYCRVNFHFAQEVPMGSEAAIVGQPERSTLLSEIVLRSNSTSGNTIGFFLSPEFRSGPTERTGHISLTQFSSLPDRVYTAITRNDAGQCASTSFELINNYNGANRPVTFSTNKSLELTTFISTDVVMRGTVIGTGPFNGQCGFPAGNRPNLRVKPGVRVFMNNQNASTTGGFGPSIYLNSGGRFQMQAGSSIQGIGQMWGGVTSALHSSAAASTTKQPTLVRFDGTAAAPITFKDSYNGVHLVESIPMVCNSIVYDPNSYTNSILNLGMKVSYTNFTNNIFNLRHNQQSSSYFEYSNFTSDATMKAPFNSTHRSFSGIETKYPIIGEGIATEGVPHANGISNCTFSRLMFGIVSQINPSTSSQEVPYSVRVNDSQFEDIDQIAILAQNQHLYVNRCDFKLRKNLAQGYASGPPYPNPWETIGIPDLYSYSVNRVPIGIFARNTNGGSTGQNVRNQIIRLVGAADATSLLGKSAFRMYYAGASTTPSSLDVLQGTAIITNSTDLVLQDYVVEGFQKGILMSNTQKTTSATPSLKIPRLTSNYFLGNKTAIETGLPFLRASALPPTACFYCPPTGPPVACLNCPPPQATTTGLNLSCNLFDPGKLDANGLVSRSWLNQTAPSTAIGIDIAPIGGASALKFTNIGRPSNNPEYTPGANVWPVDDRTLTHTDDVNAAASEWESTDGWQSIVSTSTAPIYNRYKNEFLGTGNQFIEGIARRTQSVSSLRVDQDITNGPNCTFSTDPDIFFPRSVGGGEENPSARAGLGVANENWLGQNVPNPSSTSTNIPYNISEQYSNASILVFSISSGQILSRLEISSKTGAITVNLNPLTNGIYGYRLEIDGVSKLSRKMIVRH